MRYFQYDFLNKKDKQLYNGLLRAIDNYHQLYMAENYTIDSINTILHAILIDNPRIFWFEGMWKIIEKDGIRYIVLIYSLNKVTTQEAKKIIDIITKEMRAKLFNSSPFEKIFYTYNWLLEKVKYEQIGFSGQTIYDALVCKTAVCKGISKSFQYLINSMNCFSTLQEGTIDGLSRHVWNIVEVDNQYFNIDVTMGYKQLSLHFNRDKEYNKYRYFLISNEQIAETHCIYDIWNSVIKCNNEYRKK